MVMAMPPRVPDPTPKSPELHKHRPCFALLAAGESTLREPTLAMVLTRLDYSTLLRIILGTGLMGTLVACADESLALFSESKPALEPEKYFSGKTNSWGLFETPRGEPKELLFTQTRGRLENRVLHFEQDLTFGSGKKQHRSWLIRRTDAHHYTAIGTGIIGTAHGVTEGNAFHLEFILDAWPGNPLGHLHMSQWMFLQPDGVTLINRDTLSKAGIIITEITERFSKER